ncbi:MutH/Sau3AI family endonuclease [Haladaptatus sp. GCM10025707]|uniref:MutH/Sau3AI family endonuclease n=1 Tax=Haladaptatus sp. GCM10025707 TaxID=3252658 RepID=UPI00361099DC
MVNPALGRNANEDEIKAASDALLGKTLQEISESIHGRANSERHRSKMAVANLIEEDYFGIQINSDQAPDFEQAGIELKVTPLKTTGGGKLVRPKERLVLSMVDYGDIVKADHWTEVPALEKKLQRLLIIWYLHLQGENRANFPIIWHNIWEPSEERSKQIQADFKTIQEKVQQRESPSERHTEFLGTCPKHGGGFDKENPENSSRSALVAPGNHPFNEYAERRGWTIKSGAMLEVLHESTGLLLASEVVPRVSN